MTAAPESVAATAPDLVRHVTATTGLPQPVAARVVADVIAYFSETAEEFVRRRHRELKRRNLTNARIWPAIAAEMTAWRFGAPAMSERQLRRIVYG